MITIDDIDNELFVPFPTEVKERYAGYANEEVRDVAIRLGADPTDIAEPLHFKIKRHAVNVALNMFGQDYIGVNNSAGMSGEDVYDDLFKRTNWILQKTRNSLSLIMFTGGTETPLNRAVESVRLHRG